MSNYNFTQSLDGLNNIESNNINTENLSVNNLNVNYGTITTLSNSNLINCTTTTTPVNPNDIPNKYYVDGMPVHQILNTNNIWLGTNQYNQGIILYDNSTSTNSTIKQTANNMLINNLVNSGQIILNLKSSGGTQRDLLTIDFTKMILNTIPLSIQWTTNQYSDIDQTGNAFTIYNRSTSGVIKLSSRDASAVDTQLMSLSPTAITLGTSASTLTIPSNTTFSQTATFTVIPSCSVSATTANELVNFTTLNAQSFVKPSFNNSWSGTNSFNTSIPTTNINANANNQIVNWQTLNAQSFVKPSFNNSWSGTNSFNTSIPTTNINATINDQIVNWQTLNAQSFVKPSFNNSWSGTNSFNTIIPTTTINANANNQIVNWQTLNGQSFTTLGLVQSNANTFLSTNTFSNPINANGQLNLKNNLLIYDLLGLTNYHRLYQSGQIFSIVPTGGISTTISLSCLNSGGSNVETLKLTSTDATITGSVSVSSNLTVGGVSTFNGDLTSSYNLNLYDTANPLKYTKISMYLNNFDISTLKTGGSLVDTTMTFNINLAGGASKQVLKLENSLTTFGGAATIDGNLLFNNSATTYIDSSASTAINLFQSISNGAVSLFESLASNSIVKMFSDVASNVNLYINARVRFRNTKFYNQVKTISASSTLNFPLEEFNMITATTDITITLPTINSSTQLGMTFIFNKARSTTNIISFTAQGTNTIVQNGSITGSTSNSTLMIDGITTVEFVILEQTAGVYNWVEIGNSLPKNISNPVGCIITMPNNVLPAGYFFCNGASLSTTTYANLFAVIGYTHGGSGASFSLPMFNNGSFLRGFSSGVSAPIGTLQSQSVQTHTHDIKFGYNQAYQGTGGSYNAYSSTAPNYNNPGGIAGNLGVGRATGITELNTAGSPNETRPLNHAVYFCIKY